MEMVFASVPISELLMIRGQGEHGSYAGHRRGLILFANAATHSTHVISYLSLLKGKSGEADVRKYTELESIQNVSKPCKSCHREPRGQRVGFA